MTYFINWEPNKHIVAGRISMGPKVEIMRKDLKAQSLFSTVCYHCCFFTALPFSQGENLGLEAYNQRYREESGGYCEL